jgi:hypothetical protein
MEELAKQINSLSEEDLIKLNEALENHILLKKTLETTGTCPTGYYWNGSACVLNVGP